MRTAVIVHVFYPEFWPELARCIRNIGGDREIFVTYSDEASVAGARRDFPEARFVRCENRGYDVWPFLKVLQDLDLPAYDLVVKLHTKRDIDQDLALNHAWLADARWRELLLSFVRTPANWRRTLRKLAEPGVGMVADRRLVFDRNVTGPKFAATFDRAKAELERLSGRAIADGLYVAGTMFAARAEALAPLRLWRHAAEDFEAYGGHERETHAHVMERTLGLSVSAAGLRIAAFNGSVEGRRWYYSQTVPSKILRFFFCKRVRDWRYSVRILGIPVWTRRMRRIDKLV